MRGISHYENVVARLTPEALALVSDMVAAHLKAGSGDRAFILASSASASALIFTGQGAHGEFENVDRGALEDLAHHGLLRRGRAARGSPTYRVSGDGLRFHKWLMNRDGEAVEQTEAQVQRMLEGGAFAKAHPRTAHHLREALALVWDGRDAEEVVSEIGDHLRKALMDITTDIVSADAPGKQEKPIVRLEAWASARSELSKRETAVLVQLVELARVVLALDQRLNHVRDEADKGVQAPSWDETRRAAFTTAFVCYELARAASRL
jgi:hypothetical protein